VRVRVCVCLCVVFVFCMTCSVFQMIFKVETRSYNVLTLASHCTMISLWSFRMFPQFRTLKSTLIWARIFCHK